MSKNQILIVDDSAINRELLSDIISSKYQLITANNGKEAIRTIELSRNDISLILLDLIMPELDGFGVLAYMQRNGFDDIPVIIISSETEPGQIEKAYSLGAIDFINRPYNEKIIMHRIRNTLALYAKTKNLEEIVVKQFFDKERNSQVMIGVLANIVEFRNGESGLHVIHIRAFTNLILHTLKNLAPQYNLTSEMITNITNASALHDIGKISISQEILNKPGRLTDEEFATMKTHSAEGALILENSGGYETSKFVQIARDIARWHHERWDGRGYPDGLKGENIPIGAQVVALADVYDALISERCYKPAYPHDVAVKMILNGECGVFNPVLMECLEILAPQFKEGLDNEYLKKIEYEEINHTAQELMSNIGNINKILYDN